MEEKREWKMPMPEAGLFSKEDVVLYGYRGSQAHGTYVPAEDPNSTDDIDTMGVFIYPLEYYFGVPGGEYRRTWDFWEGEWDVVYYEISHFFRMLMKSNPNVTMMLFLRDADCLHLNEAGRAIVENRGLFCSRIAADTFIGYAQAQLKKMTAFKLCNGHLGEKRKRLIEKFGFDTKNASHCIRLLRMGHEFLETGVMNVFREDAEELIAIKKGEWPLERVKSEAESMFVEIEEIKKKSPLPEKPDVEGINELLVSILKKRFEM